MADPRFAQRQGRLAHRFELKEELETALLARPADQWWALLAAAGVPTGPVLSVPDALEQPHVVGRDLVSTFADCPGIDRDIRVMRPGFKIDGKTPSVKGPPPRLSQDTDRILASLGYSANEINALHEEGAI